MLPVAFEVIEEALAVDALEGGPPAEHGVEQPTRRAVVHLAPHDRRALQRVEAGAHGRQRKAAVVGLDHHVLHRETPQHTGHGAGIDTDGLGHLGPAPRPVRQHARDPELGRDVQQLRRDEAVQEPQELPGR